MVVVPTPTPPVATLVRITPQDSVVLQSQQISLSDKSLYAWYASVDSVIIKTMVTFSFYAANRNEFVLGWKHDFNAYGQPRTDDYFEVGQFIQTKDARNKEWVSFANTKASGLGLNNKEQRKVLEMSMPLPKFQTYPTLKVGIWLDY